MSTRQPPPEIIEPEERPVVKSETAARGGRGQQSRPVLRVLTISLTMAIVAFVGLMIWWFAMTPTV